MRMSLWALLACALTINSVPVAAQEKPAGGAASRPARDDAQSIEDNNQATKEKLSLRLEAEFQEVPLKDVLSFLAEKLDIEVFPQRKEIEEVGAPLDTPVTLQLKRVRGDMLLDLVLRQVSPDIGYVVRDGIVIVSGKGSLSDHLAIRVYNCRDLLASAAKPAATDEDTGSAPAGTSRRGYGGGPYAPAGGTPAGAAPGGFGGDGLGGAYGGGGLGMVSHRSPEVDQFVRLLQTTVAPDTWDVNGGPGTLEEFGGLLVVNQTEEIHDRIEKLLTMLREAAGKKPGGE